MTSHIPENFSTWLVDWSLVTIMGDAMPPRDPNDDDDDEDEEDEEDEHLHGWLADDLDPPIRFVFTSLVSVACPMSLLHSIATR
jgi:hypothetical protein